MVFFSDAHDGRVAEPTRKRVKREVAAIGGVKSENHEVEHATKEDVKEEVRRLRLAKVMMSSTLHLCQRACLSVQKGLTIALCGIVEHPYKRVMRLGMSATRLSGSR